MTAPPWKPWLAEFAGTYLLVLFAAGAVTLTARLNGSPIPLICGSSSGFILTAVICLFARISGAHVNPAFTVGLAYLSRFPWSAVPGYLLAQLAGSTAGGLTVLWLAGDVASVGANIPNAELGISASGALALEAILSFIMMMTILLCGDVEDGRIQPGAIRIGAIVGIEVWLFGPIGGAAMNPARAFGPYLARGDWQNYWIYVAGPLAGIMAAAAIYRKAAAWTEQRAQTSK